MNPNMTTCTSSALENYLTFPCESTANISLISTLRIPLCPCKHFLSPSICVLPLFGAASPPAIASSALANYLTLPCESTAFISFIPALRIPLCPCKPLPVAIHSFQTSPFRCRLPSPLRFQRLSKLFDPSMRIYSLYFPYSCSQNPAVSMQTPPFAIHSLGISPF